MCSIYELQRHFIRSIKFQRSSPSQFPIYVLTVYSSHRPRRLAVDVRLKRSGSLTRMRLKLQTKYTHQFSLESATKHAIRMTHGRVCRCEFTIGLGPKVFIIRIRQSAPFFINYASDSRVLWACWLCLDGTAWNGCSQKYSRSL